MSRGLAWTVRARRMAALLLLGFFFSCTTDSAAIVSHSETGSTCHPTDPGVISEASWEYRGVPLVPCCEGVGSGGSGLETALPPPQKTGPAPNRIPIEKVPADDLAMYRKHLELKRDNPDHLRKWFEDPATYPFKIYNPLDIPVPRIKEAVGFDPKKPRVSLVFKDAAQQKAFVEELLDLLKKAGIDDAKVVFVGSSVEGLSGNPKKHKELGYAKLAGDLKNGTPGPFDLDVQVWSKKLSSMCHEKNVSLFENMIELEYRPNAVTGLPEPSAAKLTTFQNYGETGVQKILPQIHELEAKWQKTLVPQIKAALPKFEAPGDGLIHVGVINGGAENAPKSSFGGPLVVGNH